MTPEKNPYRLDPNIRPVSYRIHLEPDLEKFTFCGNESVEIRAKKPFSTVELHAVDLKITRVVMVCGLGPSQKRVESRLVRYDAKRETATIDFGRIFRASEARALELDFTGELNDKMNGFYRTSYEAAGVKKWGAATQFEATDARRAFPSWDEPDRKATFHVSLTVPREMTALSNMPVESESSGPGPQKKTVVYETSPVMSTYLLCFVVAELEFLEATDKDGVKIRVYTSPGKKNQGRFALDVALHTLPYFARWFGIPYSLPKLDMVSLPDFASGAMENWGLVTYRETALLVDPKNSSSAARQRVASVIDHELAHQWFGNLVTMQWWTDLWLNEGFASYVGPKAVDAQFPEWDTWTQFVAGECLGSMHSDSLKNSHPIEIPVKNPHEIREIFDAITYGKGSSVNRMLEHYLGEEIFRRGLRVYLKQYAFGNATTLDLWTVLERVSGKPVTAMMESFTRQEGYPVLTVRRSASAGRSEKETLLDVSQKRFIFDGSADRAKLRWRVPVGANSHGMKKPVYAMMDKEKVRIRVPARGDEWIKLNPGQSGFYRVAYSPELLARLIPALEKELPVVDRLGLLDDTFVLARAGELGTTQVLDILAGCEGQSDYNVWVTIAGIVAQIENILNVEDQAPFRLFARKLYGGIGRRLGWSARTADRPLDLLLRPLILGRLGHYGEEKTLRESARRFEAFIAGGPLDPNLRGAVFMTAAEHGSSAELKKLCGLYVKTGLQEEKIRVLRALTRFSEVSLVRSVLTFAMSDAVRSQDKFYIFTGFGANARARRQSWDFLKREWRAVEKLYAGGNVGLLSRTMEGAVSGFVSKSDLEDASRFFASHRVPGTERATRQAVEIIRANIAWAARDRRSLSDWLRARTPSRPFRAGRLQKA